MKSDRFKRIKEIFQAALNLDPGERKAFLDDACQGDSALRAKVENLLDRDSMEDSFLETPVVSQRVSGADADTLLNTRLGQYLLERVISSGGMGTVYEALQEHPRRTVAVKVMKQGLMSRSAQRRFEYEAQILAKLRHPGIAQVIEAGTHGDSGESAGEDGRGVPYFVMEYIPDARSLTDYAMQKNLKTRNRLTLFIQVCDAVHHGHQRGIIHRDLKPGNILVDAQGQVKIIDFGVARVTDSDVALTTVHTEVGQLIGTLQYMSPEQFKADPHDLDIRSDVYALGVVLYEVLCGILPYDVRKTPVFEAARLIREEQPKRPSTMKRILKGDVETIVLKALEKDRGHRYQSVSDLGADINRYLGGQVIHARPASPVTKIWKGVKRKPVLSTAVSAVFLCLLAFILYVVLWSFPRLQEEKAKLEEEMGNTQKINAFLNDMLQWVNPYREGRRIDVEEMLNRAAVRIDKEFPNKPEIEGSLRTTLGMTFHRNGLYDAAETQYEKALEMARRIYGTSHPNTYNVMAKLAGLHTDQGRFKEAETLTLQVLEGRRRLLGDEHAQTTDILNNLAELYMHQDRFEEAEPLLLDVIEKEGRRLGENHKDTLTALGNLASLYWIQGMLEKAEPLSLQVYEGRRQALGEDHPDTLTALNSLAGIYWSRSQFDKAGDCFLKVLEGRRQILGEEHPDTIIPMNNLIDVYTRQRRLDEAERLAMDALKWGRRVLGDGHIDTLISMNALAEVYILKGRLKEAEPLLRELVALTPRDTRQYKNRKALLDQVRKKLGLSDGDE